MFLAKHFCGLIFFALTSLFRYCGADFSDITIMTAVVFFLDTLRRVTKLNSCDMSNECCTNLAAVV